MAHKLIHSRRAPRSTQTYSAQRARSKVSLTLLCAAHLSALASCTDPEPSSTPSAQAGVMAGVMAGQEGGAQAGQSAGVEAGVQTGGEGGSVAQSCEPNPAQLDEMRVFLNDRCGLCHGETPQFGAPNSFTNLEAMLEGADGARLIDRVIARLVEGTMPPTGQPQPTSEQAQALIDWASCGEGPQRLSPPGGFEVSRPRYPSAGAPPTNAEVKELLAPQASVSATEVDQYRCFVFRGPGEPGEERGIVRFEPVIDDARVVHHLVLYETPNNAPFEEGDEGACGAGLEAAVYAWAPGQAPLQFTEGALVSGGDKRYVLEVHYNNSAGLEGVRDSSGVRVYHTPPHSKRIDMMTLGPDNFTIPARSREEFSGQCEVQEELEVVALMPHMHELGVRLSSQVQRGGDPEAPWEDMITLDGWDFNFQLVYDAQGMTLSPGDVVKTSCLFENTSDRDRRFGPFTEDEMCYHFVYVSPPPSERRCNESAVSTSFTYEPGECAPSDALGLGREIMGGYRAGQPPAAEGGELLTGRFTLTQLELWFESFDVGPAVLDPEASYYQAAGSLELTEGGALSLDMMGTNYVTTEQGAQFTFPVSVGFGGAVTPTQDNPQALTLSPSCPGEAAPRPLAYTATPTSLTLMLPFSDPVEGTQVMRFELVP